jgi:hypothetical protein
MSSLETLCVKPINFHWSQSLALNTIISSQNVFSLRGSILWDINSISVCFLFWWNYLIFNCNEHLNALSIFIIICENYHTSSFFFDCHHNSGHIVFGCPLFLRFCHTKWFPHHNALHSQQTTTRNPSRNKLKKWWSTVSYMLSGEHVESKKCTCIHKIRHILMTFGHNTTEECRLSRVCSYHLLIIPFVIDWIGYPLGVGMWSQEFVSGYIVISKRNISGDTPTNLPQ